MKVLISLDIECDFEDVDMPGLRNYLSGCKSIYRLKEVAIYHPVIEEKTEFLHELSKKTELIIKEMIIEHSLLPAIKEYRYHTQAMLKEAKQRIEYFRDYLESIGEYKDV